MSKIILIFSIALLVIPVFVVAQEENEAPKELVVGDKTVVYTDSYTITSGRLYYSGDDEANSKLVASTHDSNGDDEVDVWLVYDVSEQVTTEAYDTSGDGTPDVFLTLNSSDEVTAMTGDGAAQFTRDTTVPFSPEPSGATNQEADLVGDLSDVTIAHKDNNWIFFVILLVVGVVLYFFWKRQT